MIYDNMIICNKHILHIINDEKVIEMKFVKLKDFVTFVPGINQSRVENQFDSVKQRFYDQTSFEIDFYFDHGIEEGNLTLSNDRSVLHSGDIVINNTKQLASVVGTRNSGKLLSLNFTKVQFLNSSLDKNFFLYLFNLNKDVQRQKERGTQGTGMIQKIPLCALGELMIPYINNNDQITIGNSYVEMIRIQNNLKKISALTERLTCMVLENAVQEAEKDEE